jgi:DUF971 family protein
MEIEFPEGKFELTYEFLRVFSPSADVMGHTPDEAKLQVGKRDVEIKEVKPVGEYAIQPVFSDGHDSGIYSWDWLYDIAVNKDALWAAYLEDLKAHGASRDPADPANAPFLAAEKKGKCPSQSH